MAWEDSDELEKLHRRVHQLMKRMWEPLGEEIESIGNFPVDVEETDENIVAKADLPGFKKDEVALKVTENSLEISAEHKEKKIEKTAKTYRAERKFGSFKRFLTLPAAIDYEKTDAKFENGLLTVSLPKREKKKVGKEVKIK